MSVHGDRTTIEQMGVNKTLPPPFMVTRHTPRISNNVRPRTTSLDLTLLDRDAKKIKMEEKPSNEKQRSASMSSPSFLIPFLMVVSADPLLKSSGAKPTKKEPAKATKDGALFGNSNDIRFVLGCGADIKNPPPTNGPPVFTASLGATNMNQSLGASPNVGHNWGATSFQQKDSFLSQQHTAILQNQLTLTSSMCSQLLQGQNNLIRAVCQRLDHTEFQSNTQEQVAAMQQYQMELEAYYHQLCESYMLVSVSVRFVVEWTRRRSCFYFFLKYLFLAQGTTKARS